MSNRLLTARLMAGNEEEEEEATTKDFRQEKLITSSIGSDANTDFTTSESSLYPPSPSSPSSASSSSSSCSKCWRICIKGLLFGHIHWQPRALTSAANNNNNNNNINMNINNNNNNNMIGRGGGGEFEEQEESYLKQQSLYTIWNIFRFIFIGIFGLYAAYEKQHLLETFYDNVNQCCYCLLNVMERSPDTRLRLEWSVCETQYRGQFCIDDNNKNITYAISDQCDSNHFSCESSLFLVKWHKSYPVYGWTQMAVVLFYAIILYLVTRCYPSLGIYIIFYNILVSMGCVYWLLQIFQFFKSNKNLTDNYYNDYGVSSTVSSYCYRDDFPSDLLKMTSVFLLIAISLALFPIIIVIINLPLMCCNRGDSWYHNCGQYMSRVVRSYGGSCYVVLAILSSFCFLAGLIWGLVVISESSHHRVFSQVLLVIICSILAASSWFDIYFIGYCTCFGNRCCCNRERPWFCKVQTDAFMHAVKTFCIQNIACCRKCCGQSYDQRTSRYSQSISVHESL